MCLLQTASTVLRISVTDINDNDPRITNTEPVIFTLRENKDSDFLGTIKVSDCGFN